MCFLLLGCLKPIIDLRLLSRSQPCSVWPSWTAFARLLSPVAIRYRHLLAALTLLSNVILMCQGDNTCRPQFVSLEETGGEPLLGNELILCALLFISLGSLSSIYTELRNAVHPCLISSKLQFDFGFRFTS